MLNWLWAVLMAVSLIGGAVTGNLEAVNRSLLGGGNAAVTLAVTLTGSLCFWSGLLRVADRAGLTVWLSRLFAPFLRVLFPGLPTEGTAARAILMNMSANFLGLGNAATPFGLKAMQALQDESTLSGKKDNQTASGHMITFVVLNTASIQLIPTTVAALRLKHGSADPMMILPAVWITSIGAAAAAVFVARILCLGKSPKNALQNP